jgi:hypothetical protein
MHSKNVLLRFAALVVAAILATLSVSAVTTSSSAALPVPFTQRTVKISNAYQQAQCSIVINGTDFNGHETGYIDAQSQANLLGGFVKSTTINCYAYESTFSTLVDYFTYSGTGPTLLNTRKNGSYPLSSTYHICIVLTTYTYSNGSATSSKCA